MDDEDRRSPAEKVVAGSLIDESGVGKPLSERTLQRQRSVESYLLGEAMPRYMQRAREIERGLAEQERRLAVVHARLREELPPAEFARAWEQRAHTWDLAALNALIATHNEWYPIERDLPMDPRTGDYVPVNGRSHRREHVGPDWILERFAPTWSSGPAAPAPSDNTLDPQADRATPGRAARCGEHETRNGRSGVPCSDPAAGRVRGGQRATGSGLQRRRAAHPVAGRGRRQSHERGCGGRTRLGDRRGR